MLTAAGSVAREALHHFFPRTSFRLIHSRRRHDEIEVKLLPLLVQATREAVDVGANVGRYTKPMSQLARRVHAFEPHPRLSRILRASLPKSVTVYQVALSDEGGRALLHVPLVGGRQNEGIAHLSAPAEDEECAGIETQTATLDSFNLRDVGFLKVDVEGHECEVLAGAAATIEACRPGVIVESEDRHRAGATAQVHNFFAERGYGGFFVFERRLHDIAAFSPEMQDPKILDRTPAGSARDSIPYVNNFIFVPRHRMPPNFKGRCDALLAK